MTNNDDVPAAPKTVFVHVGSRKTGTSHLQFGLKRAPKRVIRAGLAQPLGERGGIMRGLLLPLQAAADGDLAAAERAVTALARNIRESEQPRHLITLEALAELPVEATAPLIRGLTHPKPVVGRLLQQVAVGDHFMWNIHRSGSTAYGVPMPCWCSTGRHPADRGACT